MIRRGSGHLAALLLAGMAFGGCAASMAERGPSVVWTNRDRVYVASRDSVAFAPGDSVWFRSRGRAIAAGTVATTDGRLATVDLSMGSVTGSRLDRIEVTVVRPSMRPPEALRIGFPSGKRIGAYVGCPIVQFHAPEPAESPWPATLEPRAFDDEADEEIAVERGELDVALFWPGELSARLRSAPHWSGSPSGRRARGFFALTWSAGGVDSMLASGDVSTAFAKLNRDLFRGDLEVPAVPGKSNASESTPALPFRVDVDPSCPHRSELQSYLDRVPVFPSAKAHARLVYLDLPLAPGDSLEPRVGGDGAFVMPLFAVRCQVVCAPELRRFVMTLGPDALVNVVGCP